MRSWQWTLLACAFGLGLGIQALPWPKLATLEPAVSPQASGDSGLTRPAPTPAAARPARLSQGVNSSVGESWPIRDSDTTPLPFALDQQKLDQLLDEGTLILPHPQGGSMQLQLLTSHEQGRLQLLRLQVAGLPGQVTRSANGFFGTLATDRGVYSIENHGVTTHIVNQQQLDQRQLPGFSDARPTPQS